VLIIGEDPKSVKLRHLNFIESLATSFLEGDLEDLIVSKLRKDGGAVKGDKET
jgi:hypothetical protein